MKRVMQLLIGLVSLFNVAVGLGFLLNPAEAVREFALTPEGVQGLASLRADFPAFFLTGALFAGIASWRADRKPLLVPLALLGIALFGRFVSIVLDGAVATTAKPMVIEATMLVLLLVAYRAFGRTSEG